MKPTAADVHLWEAIRSRRTPAWVRAFDEKRASRTWAPLTRDQVVARAVHAAINSHANWKYPKFDVRNAVAMLEGWERQLRERGYTFAGASDERPRTLGESMRCSLRDYGHDAKRNPRAPTYVRILRRLERAAKR